MKNEHEKQMSESFKLGALLAIVGGFLDVYTYNNRNLLSFNILCLSIALISGLLVYLKYKNKEKIIMKLERNS